jgi:hypothetical protein
MPAAAMPATTVPVATVPATTVPTTTVPTTTVPVATVPATTTSSTSAVDRIGDTGRASASGQRAPTTSAGPPPLTNTAIVGVAESAAGSAFKPPLSPTSYRYSSNCHSDLIDPGFSGQCVVVEAPTGTVAGIVEQETAAEGSGTTTTAGANSSGVQERDLVYHRKGAYWDLAQVHTFDNPGPASLVWAADIENDGDPKLVFVRRNTSRYAEGLDLVEGTGDVVLHRPLENGFVVAAPNGGLVTYVPVLTDEGGSAPYYEQTLIGYSTGSWRVLLDQYVPYAATMAQHRGVFWGPGAKPAS